VTAAIHEGPDRLTPRQIARLDALLVAKRAFHPELARPLTMTRLRSVLRREHVELKLMPHPRDAELVHLGRWVLILNSEQSDPARMVAAAHEYAHFVAHRQGHEPPARDVSPPWWNRIQELEADYLSEAMLAGPPISGIKKPRKRRHAASGVPLATRKPAPPAQLPGWLEDVERDADAVRLKETAKAAAREDARRAPKPADEPTIRFAIPREQWAVINLLPLSSYPHYSNVYTAPHHEYVSATISAARGIVEQLTRAGFKRTAVHVRRKVREALHSPRGTR